MTADAWLEGWAPVLRTVAVGGASYAVLVLHVSSKRTPSKFNEVGVLVAAALGSTLAIVLVSSEVAFTQGLAAFAVLIGLQLAVTRLPHRPARVRSFVRSEPDLLLYRGEFIEDTLRREGITRDLLLALARSQGIGRLGDVEAMVLETDGSIAVLCRAPAAKASSLTSVDGYATVRRVQPRGEPGAP